MDGLKKKPRGKPFKKGVSGNPGGRPRGYADLQALARKHSEAATTRLAHWMKSNDAQASIRA